MTLLLNILFLVFSVNLETSTADPQASSSVQPNGVTPSSEFSHVTVVRPRLYHGQDMSNISSTKVKQEGNEHIHHVIVGLEIDGREHIIDLTLDKDLLPKGYYEKHQMNGSYVISRPEGKEVELCHYHGKLRGVDGSWAAISTCQGLSGVLHDNKELYYLERATNSSLIHNVNHYIYANSHLSTNFSQGIKETGQSDSSVLQQVKRLKRAIRIDQGGYEAGTELKQIDLALVVDHVVYMSRGQSIYNVRQDCLSIANIVRGFFKPLKITISLVGLVVWKKYDKIVLSRNIKKTLKNFAKYRNKVLNKKFPNDNAQLLTWTKFSKSKASFAYHGTICKRNSVAINNMRRTAPLGLIAKRVTHGLGHNFGMRHDFVSCHCPGNKCIMNRYTRNGKQWSSCSQDAITRMSMSGQFRKCIHYTPKWESGDKVWK